MYLSPDVTLETAVWMQDSSCIKFFCSFCIAISKADFGISVYKLSTQKSLGPGCLKSSFSLYVIPIKKAQVKTFIALESAGKLFSIENVMVLN